MKQYLSYGGGVNSTALLLLLTEEGAIFEAVFADHGADYPDTYEYVEMLQRKGYPITVIKARRAGLNLYDYCFKYRILPSFRNRSCTDHFKVKPLNSYYQMPCYDLLGIDAGEAQRASMRDRKGIIFDYPLVERGIDRQGCIEIIKHHGLPVPMKSGCYFCPFQRVAQIKMLRDHYPELWCKALQLEQRCIDRRKEQGKKPYYIYKKPLNAMVQEGQYDLFGERKPCRCDI